jgi:hypothetical protein
MLESRKIGLPFQIGFLFLIGLLSSCNMPAPEISTPDLLGTAAAQTIEARLTQDEGEAEATSDSHSIEPSPTPESSEATSTPTPTITKTPSDDDCTQAIFVDDVTIADGTEFKPGTKFTKTWRLRNGSDCPWTTEYELVFFDGDLMGAEESYPLLGEVQPGEEVDISIEFTAPEVEGSYRSDWRLKSPSGVIFGTGADGDQSFFVEIVISSEVEDLDLGPATWRDSFNGYIYWYLLDTDNTKFEIKNDTLVMTTFGKGGLDEWGLSNRPVSDDFYLEMIAKTGDQCAGKDRYGVLVRASDPNHAYVFGFTCNGQYRLYRWNDGEFKALAGWTGSPYIVTGPDQTNRLGILVKGSTFKLYANGKLLTSFTDSEFKSGRFGLFIAAEQTDNFEVFVEEVAYWEQ